MSDAPALEIRNVSKAFGSVNALENVNLRAERHEVHAIVGDNGAGKSTLIKILAGIHQRDDGSIAIQGEDLASHLDTVESQHRGIAVVYQDLALVECLDIAANMALGNLPRRWALFLDRQRMNREAAAVLRELGARVEDVSTPVGLLSGGQRQVIAIARAVRMDKPIVLLDEPTAALGVRESAQVGQIIDGLRDAGKAVILVSHDLEFVMTHADRVTVLRLGNTVGTRRIVDVTRDQLISMITGLWVPNEGDSVQTSGKSA
ncbi:D-xylose transport system ATP-binding protein [Marmoricola sp. URHA0025 HA25]